jgi:hypothetical protein
VAAAIAVAVLCLPRAGFGDALAADALATDPFAAAMADAAAGQHGAAAAGFHRLAQQGDGVAAHNLALLFMTGQGVPRHHEEAAFWAWSARLAGVTQAQTLVARLMPELDTAAQQRLADRLEAVLTPQATTGDGAAMLALAAVLGHLRPRPDAVAAHNWQSIAAALDVPGAAAARDATLATMDSTRQRQAEAAAMAAFAQWCAAQGQSAPAGCAVMPK